MADSRIRTKFPKMSVEHPTVQGGRSDQKQTNKQSIERVVKGTGPTEGLPVAKAGTI